MAQRARRRSKIRMVLRIINKKGAIEIGATILSLLVVVTATVVTMTFLLFSQRGDVESITQLNEITEGDTYVDHTLNVLMNYEIEGQTIRDMIKGGEISEDTIKSAVENYLKVVVDTWIIIEFRGLLAGIAENVEEIATVLRGGEEALSWDAKKFVESFTREFTGEKDAILSVTVSGAGLIIHVEGINTRMLVGQYKLEIKKGGALVSVIGIINDPEKAYVSKEYILTDAGEKVELTLYMDKDKPVMVITGQREEIYLGI